MFPGVPWELSGPPGPGAPQADKLDPAGDGQASCSGGGRVHAETLTELSCGGAEVELVSLLEEQLPRYRLRADTLTEFSGYDNEDWCIQVPCLPNPENLELSPELIQETLNYFVVSGERVGQMTRTYSDPEALTRLLEEKERDLELAAHIGQGLLAEKRALATRLEALELELAQAQDALTQLRHDLSLKTSLLQAYAADEDQGALTPDAEPEEQIVVSCLNRKIQQLTQENSQLKAESQSQLGHLEEEEKKEMQLIRDCIRQLSDVSRESSSLQEELSRRTEVNLRQQQEISSLSAQLMELQRYTHSLRCEAEELRGQLSLSRGLQEQQSQELLEARSRYLALKEAFLELQAELRRTTQPWPMEPPSPFPSPGGGGTSLAHELRECLAAGDSLQDPCLRTSNIAWSQSEESEESDCNDDSQYSSLSSLGLSPCKEPRRAKGGRRLGPWTGSSRAPFRLSDKLQVVKPLEGSETLQHWQRLATPGLGDLFGQDQGNGVKLRSGLLGIGQPAENATWRDAGSEAGACRLSDQHDSTTKEGGTPTTRVPGGVALRCWGQDATWEPEVQWLRLEASLKKMGLAESTLPSVLSRPQGQERPLPGTPPSSPVTPRRFGGIKLRSFRAAWNAAHQPGIASKLQCTPESAGSSIDS